MAVNHGRAADLGAIAAIQRRTIRVLVVAQVFSGAGLAAGITVGALLAQDMLGSTGLAGVPSALFTIGSAGAAIGVGRISQRWGRRRGLAAGYTAGALGSLAVVVAATVHSVPLLFGALLVYGSGTATNLQARYAGADLAEVDHHARAISTVLVATTLGAVIGPNLSNPLGHLAVTIGIPRLAGPFLLAAAAYGVAGLVIWLLLRPDPLLLTAADEVVTEDADVGTTATWTVPVIAGATVMVLTQLVMVAIMTMTPVYMLHHHQSLDAAGLVVSIHVAAMYLPSPVAGALVDRYGTARIGILAALVLAGAGVAAGLSPATSVVGLSFSLGLLGFGWSLGLIAGTTSVTNNAAIATRAQTQGTADLFVAVAGAIGGLVSGIVVAQANYAILGFSGAILAAALIPSLLAVRNR